MTTIDTSTTTAAAAAAATNKTSAGQLDANDFLKLMTTQLQTQDPFNPVDNTQMVAQMAQFTSVAGIAQMNATLTNIQSSLGASRLNDASNWIGRAALVQSDIAAPLGDGSYQGRVTLPDDADSVGINFVDASGNVVHSETAGAQQKGDLNFAWDGKDASGNVVATGPLSIQVTASNGSGQIASSVATWTGISAIQSPADGSNTKLVTPLGLLSPTDAISLS